MKLLLRNHDGSPARFGLAIIRRPTIHRPTLQITEEWCREIHFQCLEAGDHRIDAQISVDHRVTLDVQVFSDDSERDPLC